VYSDIRKHKIMTFFIIIGFIAFLSFFIVALNIYFGEGSYAIVPIAMLFASIGAIGAYYNSDKIVLKLNGARPATREENLELVYLLEGIVIATNLPMPKLYVIDDMSMNAFATGRNPENAVICVTKGLMAKLDKYELEAVLAHELAHIKNYDILLSTIVSVMVGFVVVIADILTRRMFFGRRRRSSNSDNDGGNAILMVISLIFIILSPIFMKMMQMFMSRKREYLADASAVEITRNGDAMISALAKISGDDDILEAANKSTAHMYFSAPVKSLNKKKKKSSLMSTHPLIKDRITAIKELD